jgi:hypothetical protein
MILVELRQRDKAIACWRSARKWCNGSEQLPPIIWYSVMIPVKPQKCLIGARRSPADLA